MDYLKHKSRRNWELLLAKRESDVILLSLYRTSVEKSGHCSSVLYCNADCETPSSLVSSDSSLYMVLPDKKKWYVLNSRFCVFSICVSKPTKTICVSQQQLCAFSEEYLESFGTNSDLWRGSTSSITWTKVVCIQGNLLGRIRKWNVSGTGFQSHRILCMSQKLEPDEWCGWDYFLLFGFR